MAIKTAEELLANIQTLITEDSDEALQLLEDVSDTLSSRGDETDWKKKYEDNDKQWRTRYKERFLGKSDESLPEEKEETVKPKHYSDLFK